MRTRWLTSAALTGAMLAGGLHTAASNAQTRVYIAPDDHTDYVWSADEAAYRDYFGRALDTYLDQIDATAALPSDQQMRWNVDGSLWVSTYQADRSAAAFDRLIARIRDGHIGMPLNTLVSVHGGSPLEVVLRDLYYAGRLERRYNLRFPIAIAMENQTLSYGLGSVFAGSGARYSWKGVCGGPQFAYCTNVAAPGDRENDAFWWTGPDGSRLLTKWQSLHAPLPGAQDANQGPGGYAEARYTRAAIDFATSSPLFQARWPYPIIGLFGAGWDDPEYIVPLADNRSFPTVAAETSNAGRRVIVSNQLDFFQDFEAGFGATLPTQAVSFGNEWEVNVAAFAAKSARVKLAAERLRSAEALATVASVGNPAFMTARAAARDAAFQSMGLFFEHNVGGGGSLPAEARPAFQERQAAIIEGYVGALQADASAAVGAMIPAVAGTTRIYAFNTLEFARTDIAEIAYPGSGPVQVIDVATGLETASELFDRGGARILRYLAKAVPASGYKVFELRPVAGARFAATATYSVVNGQGRLRSANYVLTMNGRGAVTSLLNRRNADRELVDVAGGAAINDFGSGVGTVALERIGPVSASLLATIPGPLPHRVRATLFAGVTRVEFDDTIDAGFDTLQTFGFGFNVAQPLVRHEEVGAVLTARLAPEGQYSARAQNSLYQWLTMNHFADMTAGDNSHGITLSNASAYFMRLGNSTFDTLDTTTPRIDVLAGGRGNGDQISAIRNQAGDSAFAFFFALQPHAAYDQRTAMNAALQHQNPLVVAPVTGPAGSILPAASWSMLRVSNTSLIVWAVKPAEDGIGNGAGQGMIVRVWNQSATPVTFSATLGLPLRAGATTRTTHIETDLPSQTGARTIAGSAIATYRIGVSR